MALLTIAPFALRFFRHLTRSKSFITRGMFFIFTFISLFGVFSLFTKLSELPHFKAIILCYLFIALTLCYIALILHVKKLPLSTEKKRLGYLLVACPIAVLVSGVDLLSYLGFNFPPITGLVLSALLYLILLIVAYPQLHELHDFFARALVIFISTIGSTIIFYFTALFFSSSTPSFAHEIRNPLGSIKGAAQYLKSEAASEEQQNLLDVIIEEVNRLNAVVHQFLDYARPYKLKFKAQNINVIIQKAISIIAANRLAENITIVRELNHNLPEEEIKNIFKPFYTTKKRGVGLGLAICQRIIKEHSGIIRVKSIPTQGTVFFIKLNAAV